MENNSDTLRDRLLSGTPLPDDLNGYRDQVTRMLEANDRRLRRERIAATAFWIFCAVSATAWMWLSADVARLPRGPFLACIFFTWGGVEIVKHYVNAARVDVLREIKQVQLQLFEMHAAK